MHIGYHRKEFLIKLFKTAVFFVVGIAFLLPLMWMLSSSLKTPTQVFAKDFRWIPEEPCWNNYVTVWTSEEVSMMRGFLNSAFITVTAIVVALLFSSLAAYAFAKVDFNTNIFVFLMVTIRSFLILHVRQTVNHEYDLP